MLAITGPGAESKRLNIAGEALELYNEFLAFGLANPDGSLIVFTGDSREGVPNLSQSPLTKRSFFQVHDSKGLVIGESYYFPQVDDWIMPIRVPIRDENDSLIAINTTAIQYESLYEDIRSFGFDDRYSLLFINNTFNTIQIKYPTDPGDYENTVSEEFDLLNDIIVTDTMDQLISFNAFNSGTETSVIGVIADQANLDHSLYVMVNSDILFWEFWRRFRLVLLAYILMIGLVNFGYRYFLRQESEYMNQLSYERDYSTSIIRGTPALLVGIDPSGNCTFVNPAAQKITGFAEQELMGHNWWKTLYPGKSLAQVSDFLAELEKGPVRNFEMVLSTKTDEKRTISWNSLNLYGDSGEIKELVLIGNDVTVLNEAKEQLEEQADKLQVLVNERTSQLIETNSTLQSRNVELEQAVEDLKKTQKSLIQAEKMASLGVLSAGIGHEINNPLNFILGGVRGLSMELSDAPEALKNRTKPFIEVVNEGVGRASEIVKSLGHFSHHGSSLNELCDLHEIIDNCLIILHNKLKQKTSVIKKYHNEPLKCIGGSGKLHQAILNVLSNSADAIEEGGLITIETKLSQDKIEISIKDNGVGISEQNLDKIMDPFFTTKAPGEGTGLGLFITSAIIEEHDGEFEIFSEEGKGTETIIRLKMLK